MSEYEMNQEALSGLAPSSNGHMPAAESTSTAPLSFADQSARLSDNMASATLRLVDAAQDFTSLIKCFVDAGKELEQSIAMVRDLSTMAQQAMQDSRQAAQEAAASARESQAAQHMSVELIERSTREHLAVAELTENLRQRIVALAVLGAPMPKPAVEAAEGAGEPAADNAADTAEVVDMMESDESGEGYDPESEVDAA